MSFVRLIYNLPGVIPVQQFIDERLIFLQPSQLLRANPGVSVANYEAVLAAYGDEQRKSLMDRLGFQPTAGNPNSFEQYLRNIIVQQQQIESEGRQVESQDFVRLIDNLIDLVGPVTLYVPTRAVPKEIIGVETDSLFVFRSYPAFIAQEVQRLVFDPLYIRATPVQTRVEGQSKPGVTVKEAPSVSVWLWSKSLGDENSEEGGFLDLTPFVANVQTNVGKNGGNFQLVLPPITCEFDPKTGWRAVRQALNVAADGMSYVFRDAATEFNENVYQRELVGGDEQQGNPGAAWRRKNFLFHQMLLPNDLVFIKFERLSLETDRATSRTMNDPLSAASLPDQVYDMIGLVDTNAIGYDPQKNEVQVNITGRDFSKLLIEDGTYFYPLEAPFYDGQAAFFKYQSPESLGRSVERIAGSLQFMSAYVDRTIEFTLRFIINQLANVRICSESVFDYYRDKSRRYRSLNQTTEQRNRYQQVIQQRVQQWKRDALTGGDDNLAKLYSSIEAETLAGLDEERRLGLLESRAPRVRTTLNLPPTVDGNGQPIRGVQESNAKKVRTAYRTFFNRIKAINKPLEADLQPQVEQIEQAGVWKIVRLVIDQEISGRRIVDSSITTQSGSLMNFVRKVVQEPFVEFYGDTYGDRFYWIIRRPPTDREAYRSNKTLDVYASDVYGDNFSFDDQQVYTWYRLIPQGNYLGEGQQIALYDFPAIYFPELAEIWGSRPLEVVCNYLDYKGYVQYESGARDVARLRQQAIEDLRYVIESSVYIPFTRKGTIILRGDRRIKVGMNIMFHPTGEIYHVDAVGQQWGIAGKIDRQTTLQVSRGMVLEHYDKYFDIVDFQTRRVTAAKGSIDREIPDYRVNRDILLFFLKRRQFARNTRAVTENNVRPRNQGGLFA